MSLLPRICSGCLEVTILQTQLKLLWKSLKGLGSQSLMFLTMDSQGRWRELFYFHCNCLFWLPWHLINPDGERKCFLWKYWVFLQEDLQHLLNTVRQEHEFCRLEVGLLCSNCVLMEFFDSLHSKFHLECKHWAMFDFRWNVCFSVGREGKADRAGHGPSDLEPPAQRQEQST